MLISTYIVQGSMSSPFASSAMVTRTDYHTSTSTSRSVCMFATSARRAYPEEAEAILCSFEGRPRGIELACTLAGVSLQPVLHANAPILSSCRRSLSESNRSPKQSLGQCVLRINASMETVLPSPSGHMKVG